MNLLRLFSFSLLALLGTAHAASVEFKSIGLTAAVMFDVPSQRGRRMFIAPPGMPVEIVVVSGEWSRVRDLSGELSWVESRALTNQRNLIVEVPQVTVRATASESGVAVFTASKGVLLELAEPITSSWIKVKHRDGETGYLKASEVWGE